jgi:hypothetical protein
MNISLVCLASLALLALLDMLIYDSIPLKHTLFGLVVTSSEVPRSATKVVMFPLRHRYPAKNVIAIYLKCTRYQIVLQFAST